MSRTAHRYGAGLPKVGTRPVRGDDRALVHRSLRVASVWVVAALLALGLGIIAGALCPFGASPMSAVGVSLAVTAGAATLLRGALGLRLTVALGLLSQVVVALLATWMPEARPPHPALVLVIQVGTLLVACGFVVARLHGAIALLRRRRELLDDLRGDTVDRCAGRLRDLAEARTFRTLQRRGDVVETGSRHEVELLPRSGFVLHVDGRAPSQPVLAPVTSIAPAVPHAMRVALPSDLSTIASPTVDLQRRGLTPAEREELDRHAARLRRPPSHLYVVIPACVFAAAWQWQYTLGEQPWLGLLAVATYVASGAAGLHYLQRMRTASRLGADASLRWLVTVTDRDAPEGTAPRLEMLPVSRLAWTEHTLPAPWRLD